MVKDYVTEITMEMCLKGLITTVGKGLPVTRGLKSIKKIIHGCNCKRMITLITWDNGKDDFTIVN